MVSLSSSESSGYDNIPIRLVKDSIPVISEVLSDLFNYAITTCTFPTCLKMGSVTPPDKKGIEYSKSSYRPITTLAAFGNIFERVIAAQLKAFFCDKLYIYCELTNWPFSESKITVGDHFSDWISLLSGIPHRSVLGTLLFNIFLNDLLLSRLQSNISSYAHDTQIFDVSDDIYFLGIYRLISLLIPGSTPMGSRVLTNVLPCGWQRVRVLTRCVFTRGTTSQRLGSISFSFFFMSRLVIRSSDCHIWDMSPVPRVPRVKA